MPLNLEQKKAIVAEVSAVAEKALSAVAADYRGLTVSQMTQLRTQARSAGIFMKVVQNKLARRALAGTSFACMHDVLVGPLVLAFSKDEPGAPARLFRDFAKDNETFQVKFLSIDGRLLDAKDISVLANLPTRVEALTKLVSVMQAPIAKFVRTAAGPHTKLVRVLAAIRDQKQAA